jgi:hypothetical protein
MALLTDGNPNDPEALRVYETSILDVANVEMIDLDAKLGLATEEVSEDVIDILLDHTRSSDPQSSIRRTVGVSDVVASPQLKRWHALHTLETVYRDAFNNQLNDRYRAKWNEYHELARNARLHTIRFGIGLALNPIPKAKAPTFATVPGTGLATTYYVQVSWVSAAGQEGSPNDLTTFMTAAGSFPVVQAVSPPATGTGWNVYIGTSLTTATLQNSAPIPIGLPFTLPGTGIVTGRPPGNGQAADIYVIGGPSLRRG